MATTLPTTNGVHDSKTNGASDGQSSFAVKAGLARMLKGGVIMDVVNAEQVRTRTSLSTYLSDTNPRPESQKKPVQSPSWLSSVYPPTFALKEV